MHLRNIQQWLTLIDHSDIVGLHRAMTGLDRTSIEMREVSPFGGILPDEQRHEVLDELRRAS